MARVIRITAATILRYSIIALLTIGLIELIMIAWPRTTRVRGEPEEVVVDSPSFPIATVETPSGMVDLLRAEICLDIKDNKPLLTKQNFNKNVDYLFCFTELSAPEKPVTILHRWRITGQAIFEKRMQVHGRNCRVWSKRQIISKTGGDGRVEIVLNNENLLGSVVFMLL